MPFYPCTHITKCMLAHCKQGLEWLASYTMFSFSKPVYSVHDSSYKDWIYLFWTKCWNTKCFNCFTLLLSMIEWLLCHMTITVTWHKLEEDRGHLMTSVSMQGWLVLVDGNGLLHFSSEVTFKSHFVAHIISCVRYSLCSWMRLISVWLEGGGVLICTNKFAQTRNTNLPLSDI